jgi:hypothetical protein
LIKQQHLKTSAGIGLNQVAHIDGPSAFHDPAHGTVIPRHRRNASLYGGSNPHLNLAL